MYMYKYKQICYLDMTDFLSRDNKFVIEIKNLLSRDNKNIIVHVRVLI